MTLDPRISEAIREAVREEGQKAVLANKLIAWMEAVSSGSEEANDRSTEERRLELLYDATTVNR